MRTLSTIAIILLFMFSSCSERLYYVYDTPEEYASLEITSKNEFFYRAFKKADNKYIFIIDRSYHFYDRNYRIKEYKEGLPYSFYFKYIYFLSDDDKGVCITKDENRISQRLRKDTIYLPYSHEFEIISGSNEINLEIEPYLAYTDPCLKHKNQYDHNLFVPYLKKSDKIDMKRYKLKGFTKRQLRRPDITTSADERKQAREYKKESRELRKEEKRRYNYENS